MQKKLSILTMVLIASNLYAMEDQPSTRRESESLQKSDNLYSKSSWLINSIKIHGKLTEFFESKISNQFDTNSLEETNEKYRISLAITEAMKVLPKSEMNKELDEKQLNDLFEGLKKWLLQNSCKPRKND
ncbi:hypothetical protein M1446_03430 [Candidatus Dependentiae bacterium]|nr:hypothetical protein [Candidatus Dependentiae bacterium]